VQPNVESGFAGFIANLVNIRSVDLLAAALARGPLSRFNPKAVTVFFWHDKQFSLLTSWALPDPLVDRYRVLAPDMRSPLEHALRDNRFIQLRADAFAKECEVLQVDHDLWADAGLEWRSDLYVILVPIYGHGEALGVLAFAAPLKISLDDSATLMGLAGTVALWLFANRTDDKGSTGAELPILERDIVPLTLTERQCEILRLIEAGQSNAAIAATTGLSISTVKVELRRAMRVLRSPNRRSAAETARRLRLLEIAPAG
jgi:DNA-binding CsgD family transcriptional regulator